MEPVKDASRRGLPRRDLILIPLLVLLTTLVLYGGAELASRALYPDTEADSCKIPDPVLGYRYKPNCVSRLKAAEGPWVVNRYNECGYRTPQSCGAKPANALRVGVIGSSTSAGYLVPYEDTLAARASQILTRLCGRPVEFQNLGGVDYGREKLIERTDEALRLKPDAIVLVMAPFDMEVEAEPDAKVQKNGFTVSRSKNPVARLKDFLLASSAMSTAQHFILRNDSTYVPMFLASGDKPDFMRKPLPSSWIKRLSSFDDLLGRLAAKATQQHVPFFLVYSPQRAQASLVASGQAPAGFDPRILPMALEKIALSHRVMFADADSGIVPGTPSEALYYPVNAHPNGEGHRLIAESLVKRMTAADVPQFGVCGDRGSRIADRN